MILAGDIGGTNTRLALFDGGAANLSPVAVEVFPSRDHKGPEEIVREFLARHNHPVDAAGFGIAGPVRKGRCETSNLPWVVDSSAMAASLGLAEFHLINDLVANAHGIAALQPDDFSTLHEGAAGAEGNRALISAGTGLGEAGLVEDGGAYRPYASEGGHADFAPRDEIEIDLLRHLIARFGRVSYERVLSGPGLHSIYQFFRDTGRAEEPPALAREMHDHDPSATISAHALHGTSELCIKAMDTFVSIYGAEAGNLALRALATGGVFLGGGIAPKILPKLKEAAFLKAFTAKGRLSRLLETIPIRVILNDQAALLGAASVAAASLNSRR